MKKLVNYMRESTKMRKALFISMIVLFAIYIFSMPYFSDRRPFNYLVYAIFALFTFLVLLCKFLYFDIRKYNYRVFILVGFAIFSSIGTILFSHEFRSLLTIYLLSFSFFVLFLFVDEIQDLDLIIRVSVYALTFFVLLFSIHYKDYLVKISNWGSSRLAADNYFDNVNGVAYYFSCCSFLSLYYVFFGKKKFKYAFLIPLLFCFFLGVLTASRAFIVSTVLSSLILFVLKFKRKPIVLITGLVLLVVAIVLLFSLPAFSAIRTRFISMFNMISGNAYSTDYSTATRILWQDYALYLGTKNILIGNGINAFTVFSGTGTYSHSNISELICNTGIIGLFLYYAIPFVSLFDCFTKNTNRKAFIIGLFVFLLAREFLDVTYTSKFNALIFALMSYSGYSGKPIKVTIAIFKTRYYRLEI